MSSMKRIKPQVETKINQQLVEFESCVLENGRMENKIGRMIKAQLQALGKSQEWLAGEVGVSSNAVSKWIKTGKVSRENAVVVADKIGLSVGQLLNDEDAKPKEREPKKMALVYIDPLEVDLVTLYREATKEGRGMIFEAAEEAPKLLTPQSASINSDKV